jgi:hypothetical protein
MGHAARLNAAKRISRQEQLVAVRQLLLLAQELGQNHPKTDAVIERLMIAVGRLNDRAWVADHEVERGAR